MFGRELSFSMSDIPDLPGGVADPQPEPDASELPGADESSPRPRVWTVFTAAGLGLVVALAAQVAIGAAFVFWYIAHGVNPQQVASQLPAQLLRPPFLILSHFPAALALVAMAVVPAILSPEPVKRRLGMVPSKFSAGGYLLLMVASIVPLAISVGLVYLLTLVITPDPWAELLYKQMTIGWAVPFVLYIALAPGISEELLFRGYIQRRLLQRWSPWTAILVTSLIFGIFHVMPHSVVLGFVIGIWLGVLAWRTGSVYPGICCHAFINGIWNVWRVGIALGAFPDTEETPLPVAIGVGVMAVTCFAYALRMLWQIPTDVDAGPAEIPTTLEAPEKW